MKRIKLPSQKSWGALKSWVSVQSHSESFQPPSDSPQQAKVSRCQMLEGEDTTGKEQRVFRAENYLGWCSNSGHVPLYMVQSLKQLRVSVGVGSFIEVIYTIVLGGVDRGGISVDFLKLSLLKTKPSNNSNKNPCAKCGQECGFWL